ncbi:MAG: type 3 dihydrofolate reductase [Candidatus Sungbacteria bacterium]|nr:type 3 dihydrofolate reductase [Candidatus Sungbacteria bacterium]
MIIALIAAMGRNRVIGRANALPWSMPADLKHFRDLTRGKPIIMGRKTFESIGRPLPDRINIIITRDQAYRAPGCVVVHTTDAALQAAGDAPEAMVIGGGEIFSMFLGVAGRMYLTYIDADFEGETRFPKFSEDEWFVFSEEKHAVDAANPYPYTFVTLERTSHGGN